MSFRARLLTSIERRGVTEESISRQLVRVIKGERVKKTYRNGTDEETGKPRLVLVQMEVLTTPKDMAAGAMLYDALRGGELGLTPRQVATGGTAAAALYGRWAPPVDRRVIATVQTEVADVTPVESEQEGALVPSPGDILHLISDDDDNDREPF